MIAKTYLSLILFSVLALSTNFICRADEVQINKNPGEICETQSIMTLAWTLCFYDNDKTPGQLRRALEMGFNEVHRIDEWMSEWKPNSLISKINLEAAGHPVALTDEAYEAISLSLEHAKLSKGSFDISFNAFFGLYNWKKGEERFPTEDEIKKILPLVNYKNIILNPNSKTIEFKQKGMKIGLGGMGEGWAVDKVFDLLKPLKIRSGYIDASGAVRVWGVKPNGKLWDIAIGNPKNHMQLDSKRVIYHIYATDIAVTTAGDSERFFYKNDKLYHHIIDPKTGYSANQSVQVSCIGPTATICDLVDDGAYILGAKEGLKYGQSQGVQLVMMDPQLKIHLSPGLKPIKTPWGNALQIKKTYPQILEPKSPPLKVLSSQEPQPSKRQ